MALGNSPIQYSSKSYVTIYNDINNIPSLRDKPEWFKRMIAGLGDMLSMYLDVQANQSFLRTAFTREAVQDLLSLIDYQIGAQSTSSGIVRFDLDMDAPLPNAIQANELMALASETSGGQLIFQARTDYIFNEIRAAIVSVSGDILILSNFDVDVKMFSTGDRVVLFQGVNGVAPSGVPLRTYYYIIETDNIAQVKLANTRRDAFLGLAIASLDPDGAFVPSIILRQLSRPVTCYQEENKENIFVGKSDGITEWQQFNIPDSNVLSVKVKVGLDYWTETESFIENTSIDQVYKVIRKDESLTAIEFGDGRYGRIPNINDVVVDYTTGGGTRSNISRPNIVNQYVGHNTDIVGCFNPDRMTGGAEEESLFNAKKYAPMMLRSQRRFVTVQDGIALVLSMGGVSRVQITPNFFGPLTALVQAVPIGGGFFTTERISEIGNFLKARSVMNIIDITVEQPNYKPLDVYVDVRWRDGYNVNNEENILWLALFMNFSERANEFFLMFAQNGVDYARQFINDEFNKTFTASQNNLLSSIIRQSIPPNFGVPIALSNVLSQLDMIPSIDDILIYVFDSGETPSPNPVGSPDRFANSLSWPISFIGDDVDSGKIFISQFVELYYL